MRYLLNETALDFAITEFILGVMSASQQIYLGARHSNFTKPESKISIKLMVSKQ
jgi:hypothetical protein